MAAKGTFLYKITFASKKGVILLVQKVTNESNRICLLFALTKYLL